MQPEVGSRIWYNTKRRATYRAPKGEYLITKLGRNKYIAYGNIVSDTLATTRPYHPRDFEWALVADDCEPIFSHIVKQTKKKIDRNARAKERRLLAKETSSSTQ